MCRAIKIFASSIIIFTGSSAFAADNPFIKPSERAANNAMMMVAPGDSQCFEEDAIEIAKSLGYSNENALPPEYTSAILGKWTGLDIKNSQFQGEVNGTRIFYSEEHQQFIYLDMNKKNK